MYYCIMILHGLVFVVQFWASISTIIRQNYTQKICLLNIKQRIEYVILKLKSLPNSFRCEISNII